MPDNEEFAALWPGGPSAVQRFAPAPRSASLDGKRVAFLWDYMFRGDEIFPLLESDLRHRFRNVEIVGHDAFGSTFGGDEHAVLAGLPSRLRDLRVDAVISGVGC